MQPFGSVRIVFLFGAAALVPAASPADHAAQVGETAQGKASFYAARLKGHTTASGEPYDPEALTAAHRTLPLGTRIKVINAANHRSVVVTVNDRGPVPKGRMLDVSGAAAAALDMKAAGVTRVRTEVVGPPDAGEP